MTHVTLKLSDELAREARAAGLLNDEGIAALLRLALHGGGNDKPLVKAAMRMSEPALREVWDNPEDAVYDRL